MNNKKLTDLTYDELQSLGSSIYREPSSIEHIQEYLVTNRASIRKITQSLSVYRHRVAAFVLMEYLEATGFKIKEQYDIDDYGRRTTFEFEEFEHEPGKYEVVPNEGLLFLENKDYKSVLRLRGWSPEEKKWDLFVCMGDRGKAQEFWRGLDAFVTARNVFKGKKIKPSMSHVVLDREYTWDSVILPPETKSEIIKNVDSMIKNIEVYRKNNLTFKRGLILKGVPGVGKSQVGRVLCSTVKDATFIWVTPGDMARHDVARRICELARELAPTVLFLEDIDLFGAARNQSNNSVLGELMNQLDGLVANNFVIVVATTNRVEEVEEALRNRPGRFDRVIDIGLPDENCRKQMLQLYTSGLIFGNVSGVRNSEQGVETILSDLSGKKTEGMTGAHIKELVNTAVMTAIDEGSLTDDGLVIIKKSHFTRNVKLVATKKISPLGFVASASDDCDDDDDA